MIYFSLLSFPELRHRGDIMKPTLAFIVEIPLATKFLPFPSLSKLLAELLDMALKWKKLLLSVLAIAITMNLMFSGTVIAEPNLNSTAIFGKDTKVIIATSSSHYTFPEEEFTPQERQELQGVRQSRNREIWEILDESQRIQIEHNLRSGKDIHQAIAELDLQIDQWDMIQAIMEWSELKMKRIIYRHSPHKIS
jgi:hypothetical protein